MENNDDLMPREKLLKFGVETLADYELLAIFLRTGIKAAPSFSFRKMSYHILVPCMRYFLQMKKPSVP